MRFFEIIFQIVNLLLFGLFIIFSWKYFNADSERFIEKVKEYKKIHNVEIPIPKRVATSFNKIEFHVENEFQKIARLAVKNLTLNDIKTTDGVKGAAIASLIAVSPGDSIVCEVTHNLKIKRCEKETIFGRKTFIPNSEVMKILNLPKDFFE
jgi:hypothetical protein